MARFAITSLAFMLLWVPEPVCQTTSGKWLGELAVDHLLGGARDRVGEPRLERPCSRLTLAAARLTMAERAHERRRHGLAADPEVLQAALGLGAPVAIGRHLDRTEGVGLDPHLLVAGHGRTYGCKRRAAIKARRPYPCQPPSMPIAEPPRRSPPPG